jgi:hypothetical protein
MAQGNGEAARGHRGAQKSIEVKAGKNSPAIHVHAGPLIGQAHIDVTFLTDRLPIGERGFFRGAILFCPRRALDALLERSRTELSAFWERTV